MTKYKVCVSDLEHLQIAIIGLLKYHLRFAYLKINTSLKRLEVMYVLINYIFLTRSFFILPILVKARKKSHVCFEVQFKPTAKFVEYVWKVWINRWTYRELNDRKYSVCRFNMSYSSPFDWEGRHKLEYFNINFWLWSFSYLNKDLKQCSQECIKYWLIKISNIFVGFF